MGSEEGDSVIRAGAAVAFQRPGMSDFTGMFGANQGIQVDAPARFDATRRCRFCFGTSRRCPARRRQRIPSSRLRSRTASTRSTRTCRCPTRSPISVGWQRKLGRDTAFELRYVGSRHRQDWDSLNLNEPNITTNGFLNEFRKAQANLQANMAAGRGNTFAYTGAPGTSPLPTFLAYFNGAPGTQAGDTTRYSGANWTNAAFLGYLAAMNPNPFGFMCNNAGGCTTATLTNGFVGNTTFRNNAAAAGLPSNFFVANPDMINGAFLTTNSGGTRAQLGAGGVPQAPLERAAFNTSYAWSNAFVLQAIRVHQATRGDRSGRAGRQRSTRRQRQLDLRAAVRPRPEVRQRRWRVHGRAHRRLVDRRRRAHSDR